MSSSNFACSSSLSNQFKYSSSRNPSSCSSNIVALLFRWGRVLFLLQSCQEYVCHALQGTVANLLRSNIVPTMLVGKGYFPTMVGKICLLILQHEAINFGVAICLECASPLLAPLKASGHILMVGGTSIIHVAPPHISQPTPFLTEEWTG